MSSLPFLAPVIWKKAKTYRSKTSSAGYGSSGGDRSRRSHRSRGFKDGEIYKLSEIGADKMVPTTASKTGTQRSGSEDNILEANVVRSDGGQTIMKSVTYTVQVDEDVQSKDGSVPEYHAS